MILLHFAGKNREVGGNFGHWVLRIRVRSHDIRNCRARHENHDYRIDMCLPQLMSSCTDLHWLPW
jgi:hypothetical protein